MKPYQLIGYSLLQTTAVTAIVGTKVYHGLRPGGTATPCINYFELNNTRFAGMENATYTINCRANTSQQARDLAREVKTLFGGADGLGVYGEQNGFSVGRASVVNDAGLVPEPEDNIFNAPVDVQIVYAVSTVA